jgi:hypothetical protein
MATVLLVSERIPGAGKHSEFRLEVPFERMTARDIIAKYVTQQVHEYNTNSSQKTSALFVPDVSERALNGTKQTARKPLDAVEQCTTAFRAFDDSRFVLLVNDIQIEELDQEIVVTPATRVTFLKLLPLVGG